MKKILIFFGITAFLVKIAGAKNFTERLLFVGEPVRILTIATGRPEMPQDAPAVADVITSKEINGMGARTLGEVLSTEPGFLVLPKESGFSLYTRGVKSGALLLYDDVPLTTESTKSVYPLGDELFVDALKRVEVIRGPASVLWGPDAFAGVVNLVLKRGRDINGVKIKTTLGSPQKHREISILAGKDLGWLDFMGFARYVGKESFLGGLNQELFELGTKILVNDELEIVGRLSQNRRFYKTRAKTLFGSHSWSSRRDIPFNLVKLKYTRKFRHTSISLKLAYSQWNIIKKEGKFSFGYKDKNWYGELKATQELFGGSGLLTLGVSLRRNFVTNAIVTIKGYIPEYIASGTKLSPVAEKRSFDSTLRSLFFQYVHKYKSVEAWLGARIDDHSEYKTSVSYTLGVGWKPNSHFSLKIAAGTAYRTPYAYHFLRHRVDPEKITNVSLEASFHWKNHIFSIVPFTSRIKDHISEDPFAGYSEPRDYSVSGFELSWRYETSKVSAWINYTLLGTKGAREKYKVLDYVIATPDEVFYFYSKLKKHIDVGSRQFASAGLIYKPSNKVNLSVKGTYRGRICYKLFGERKNFCSAPEVVLDAFLRYNFNNNFWAELKLENLTGIRREYRGVFSEFEKEGFSAFLSFGVSF